MITLRTTTPIAQKPHRCDWCSIVIQPGVKYSRSTNVYDGHLYDWVACTACEALVVKVWTWAGDPDDGVDQESFTEWARAHRLNATHGKDARAYLVRLGQRPGDGRQPCP